MKAFYFIVLVLVLPLVMLVGSRLHWDITPNFLFMEFDGLAYVRHCPLASLCDPSPLAGLEQQTSNVANQHCLSLLYSTPHKLLDGVIDHYSLNRFLGVLFFSLILLTLVGTGSILGLHWTIVCAGVVHYGMSAQLVSLLFESKLTITSALWLSTAFTMIAALQQSNTASIVRLLLLYFLPIHAAFAYETYAVSRPLALGYLFFALLWAIAQHSRLLHLAFFVSGSTVAYWLIKAAHPLMQFDATLFEGRSESIVSTTGAIAPTWIQVVRERIVELPQLLHWPHYYFSSETWRELGWLDVWLMLLFLLVAIALLSIKAFTVARMHLHPHRHTGLRFSFRHGPHRIQTATGAESILASLMNHRTILLFTGLMLAVSLLTPLASTTYLRGHRFFGLYLSSIILLMVLLDIFRRFLSIRLQAVVSIALALFSLATLYHRVPLILAWAPDPNFTPAYTQALLARLQHEPPANEFRAPPKSALIKVCDQSPFPAGEQYWNSVLYASHFGCALGGAEVLVSCSCDRASNNPAYLPVVCLTRHHKDSVEEVTLSRPDGAQAMSF